MMFTVSKKGVRRKTAAEVVANAVAELAAIEEAASKKSSALYEQMDNLAVRASTAGDEAFAARRAMSALTEVK